MLPKLFSSSLGLPFFLPSPIGALLRLSTTTTTTTFPSPPKPHEFMVEEYLITQCGLSSAEAAKTSKHLAHLKSPQKPDSVLGFIKSHGFDETHVRKLVSSHPRLLLFDVESNLAPKFKSLQDLGFTGSVLTRLLLSNLHLLNLSLPTILPRIEFWRALIGSTHHLIKIFKRGTWFLTSSVENKAIPNLSLLRDCGISNQRIGMLVRNDPTFILREPEQFKALAEHVEGLGIPRCSLNFLWALWALHHVSKATFDAKLKLMRSFGWSETEFLSAFRKAPLFLMVSPKKLSEKMEFLVNEARFEPSYISLHPTLLMYSLDRRLIPRLRVMMILKSRGLQTREHKLITIMSHSEEVFMEKYVIPHKEKVPKLPEMYITRFGRGRSS